MDYLTAIGSLFTAEGRDDPYPAYDAIRAHAPAIALPEQGVYVTSHALVNRLLREPTVRVADTSNYDEFWPAWRQNRGVASVVLSMLQSNPPDHTRVRRAAAATFTPRRIAAMRDVIADQVEDLIKAMPAEADYMTAFAYPLPVGVICALLGVPAADRPWFRQRAHDLTVVLEPISTEEEMRLADVAGRDLEDYFVGLIAERQRTPQEDLTTAFVEAGALTGEEMLANLVLLLVAGFETTANLLGIGLRLLLDHPEQAARLRTDPSPRHRLRRGDPPLRLAGAADVPVRDRAARPGRRCHRGPRLGHDDAARRGQPRPRALPRPAPLRPGPPEHPAGLLRRGRPLLPRLALGPDGGTGGVPVAAEHAAEAGPQRRSRTP